MRSTRRALGILALCLCAAVRAHAQSGILDQLGAVGAGRNVLAPNPGPPALAAMSAPIDPAEYVVGPGDLLQINLAGGVTRSWDAMVLPEGTLYVPSVGSVTVTGMTLIDARRAVLQRISTEYRGVSIDLRLLRPRNLLVYLSGETSRPGALEVSAASRASEILVEALFTPSASRRNIEIRRRTPQGETSLRVDLMRLRLTGRITSDPLLREGDVLYLPRVAGDVAVDGAVGRAGRYELTPGDSLHTLLALAGGPLPESTDQAVLVRFLDATHTDSLSFSVSDVLAHRFDVALRAGDRAFLYFQPRYHFLEQVGISGEVLRPGSYPLLPGFSRLSDLVRASGGFLPTADLGALRVIRTDPQASGGNAEFDRLSQLGRNDMTASEYEAMRARVTASRGEFRLDWARVKPGGDLDLTLRPGDMIRVDAVGASVRVEGEVRQPGIVRYEAGRHAIDYVRLAGGFSDRAQRGKVRVKRAVTGQTILAKDVGALQPGDLVWVPERPESAVWQNTQSLLLVVAQVATFIVAVRR
ncbi:MAG: SLBB domain-containing protein [Candidatus Eisenbacteria bacterium]